LLLLHGTGADEYDLLALGNAIDPAANLLSPRGLWVENGMNRFFERYPDGSFNEDSIRSAVKELSMFLAAAVDEYQLDADAIFGAGFSNGANTAAAMLVEQPSALAGAVLFGSTRPFRDVSSTPNLAGKKIWIANGRFDSYAPDAVTEAWVATLKDFGAEVKWLSHDGGHQISSEHLQEISSDFA
jgi:predicted esterase